MLTGISILVVEDDDLVARNLGIAIADRECVVVGPAPTVAAALDLLARTSVDAAVLDASLLDRNVTPVALALIDRGIPFLIHTGVGMPEELGSVYPQISLIMKPTDPDDVVVQLLDQAEKLRDARNSHGSLSCEKTGGAEAQNVDKIASALFAQFGDRAIVLARRQSVGAEGPALAAWSAIIEKMSAYPPQ